MFYAVKLKNILKKLFIISVFVFVFWFVIKTALGICFPVKYIEIIKINAEKYNLEPAFVCGIIRQESRFRKDISSHKGASGLMQIMEPTAYWIAGETGMDNFTYEDIYTPEINIEMGCWYIKRLIEQYGDQKVALSAYNAGSGNVSKWLGDTNYSQDGIKLTSVPFPETENYIQKVAFYEKIYGFILIFYGG